MLKALRVFIMFDFQDEIRRAAEVLKAERDLLSSEGKVFDRLWRKRSYRASA
jgi:hypothetical protein